MDSAAGSSAGRASASGGIAPWQLSSLLRGAVVGATHPMSSPARLWLDWIVQQTTQALERTLDRPVEVEMASAVPAGMAGGAGGAGAFAVGFSHPACADEGVLALDAMLCRAIVDTLETDFANLRGTGGLSEAELGLMEYTALSCVDHVLREDQARRFTLRRFLCGSEVEQQIGQMKLSPALLRVRVAGREGMARLYLPGWDAAGLAPLAGLASPAAAFNPAATLEIQLALPSIALAPQQADQLQCGDILLLGSAELKNLAGCRLITSTAWSLCNVEIVSDSALTTTVACGPLDPQVWEAAASQQVLLTPVIGRIRLPLGKLLAWRSGQTLDLPKETAAPAQLFLGGESIASGELVGVEGEVGVRLLSLQRGGN